MSKWFVYMLQCADGSLYTGVTTDPARRLRQHNGEIAGGAKYTKHRRPVKMIWHETQPDRSGATKREYEIKKLSRADKLLLVGFF